MTRELISKSTRNGFREVLTGFVLRDIDMIFEAAGLRPKSDHQPGVSGQRRGLVEQYYANINFTNPSHVKRLLTAYEELLEKLTGLDVVNPEATQKTIDNLVRRMERDGYPYRKGRFVFSAATVSAPSLISLSEESITEHVEKARAKIESGDHSGAIANAYTLAEGFLKEVLRKLDIPFNENEGDIRALYRTAASALNLDPKGDHLESYLKAILEGLQRQIGGLFEIANKASDRHARRYKPARHHAKLAVNATFTFCEFILDSYRYQQDRLSTKAAS
jgi:hypothetical protein